MTTSEYYDLLREKHAQTDWSDRDSIHAYNEYARSLRRLIEAERDFDLRPSRISLTLVEKKRSEAILERSERK